MVPGRIKILKFSEQSGIIWPDIGEVTEINIKKPTIGFKKIHAYKMEKSGLTKKFLRKILKGQKVGYLQAPCE